MTDQQKNLSRIIKNWSNRKIAVKGTRYSSKDKKLKIVKCPADVSLPKEIIQYINEIEELDISDTQIHEESIEIIEKLILLKKLSLDKVGFAGRSFSKWSKLRNISELKLNAVPITELPSWLCELENLKILKITNAAIRRMPSEILRNLTSLCISNTQIEKLPKTNTLKIKSLNISNTKISEIPRCYLSQNLKELNMQWCNIEQMPEGISRIQNLELINFAGLRIKVLPESMASASKIKRIDISNTPIEKLPDWIQQTGKLEYLGLNRCKLKSISKEIISHLSKRNFKNEQGDFTNKDHKGIYIKQLELEDMDVRNFKKNNKELIKALIGIEESLTPSREMKIIVMGDQGVGKTTVIRHILDEGNDNDFMISAGGLQAVDETVEINAYSSKIRLDNDAHITIWELGSEPAVQPVHHMFITDESLYIIVLDARETNKLYQRAMYWIHFIEKQAVNASVIFILTHAVKKDRDYINAQLIETSTNLRIHENVCRFFTDEVQQKMEDDADYDIEKNVLELRETLIRVIKEMPMYRMKIPSSWKRIKRHSQSLLEARNLISYQRFEDVCRYYGVKDEKIMKALAKWLCEAGAAFIPRVYRDNTLGVNKDGMPEFIYNVLWIAKGLYSIALFTGKYTSCKKNTIKDLINEFEDEVSDDQDYTPKNIQTMIEIYQDNKLCYRQGDELIFPHACSLMDSDYSKKGKKNSEKTASKWIKDILKNQNTNHYIIKCPILTADLLSSIIVITWEFYLKNLNDDQKLKAGENLLIGREGIVIPFLSGYKLGDGTFAVEDGTLMVLGSMGCPSELHIYASPVSGADTSSSIGGEEQKKFLKECADDIALRAFDESIKRLPEAGTYEFEKFIEVRQNDKKILISFDDVEGYLSVGMGIYYKWKYNMEFDTYDLADRYLPDKYWNKNKKDDIPEI